MTMHTFLLSAEDWYLVCFGVGLAFSLLTFFGGFGHLHFGHLHGGHLHLGHSHAGHTHAPHASGRDASISPLNGFTLMAFLCWFGGTGYLMSRFTGVLGLGVFAMAVISGIAGAAIIFWFLARVLLPNERVLTALDRPLTVTMKFSTVPAAIAPRVHVNVVAGVPTATPVHVEPRPVVGP